MAERQCALADRLEHEIVELAFFGEIDRRLQPIGRKAGTASEFSKASSRMMVPVSAHGAYKHWVMVEPHFT